MPDEVLVIDNNSTDSTVRLAKQYPFVRVIKEPLQGLIPTRNTGFNAAKGEIICRLDADARIHADWVATVLADFAADPGLSGVTGLAVTSLLPRLKRPRGTLHSRAYFWWVGVLYRTPVLWGATMAVRHSDWLKARGLTCQDDRLVHEDQDLSLCLLAVGGHLKLNKRLLIDTSGQTYHHFPKLVEYFRRAFRTRRWHKRHGRVPVKPEVRYSVWGVTWRGFGVLTMGIAFFVSSLVFWPIDQIMLLAGRRRSWLD